MSSIIQFYNFIQSFFSIFLSVIHFCVTKDYYLAYRKEDGSINHQQETHQMHVTHTSLFNEKWFNEINYGVWDLNLAWWKITRIVKDISSHFTKTWQMIHWWNYSRKMAKQNLYLPDKLQQRTKQILFSFLLAILFVITPTSADGDKYYGAYVGNFENRFHGIRGEVRYQIYFHDYDYL